jgi:hypothetical protein
MRRLGFGAWVVVALTVTSCTGCSFIFVTPPSTPSDGDVERPNQCTTSAVAPGFDTLFGGFEVVRTVIAASAADSVYSDPDQPLSREADVGLGIGFTALFVSSAVYGFYYTSRCSALRERRTPSYGSSNPP